MSAWAGISSLAADLATPRKSSTRRLAAAAVLSALGVVFLAIGAFLSVLDLSMAAIASLVVIVAVIELKGKYPYLVYLVTSVLSLLLPLPSKMPTLFFALFAGYYPILKAYLEGRFSRTVSWLLKIFAFLAALALIALVSVKVFTLFEFTWQAWYAGGAVLAVAVFVLYDIALTRLITAYLFRWRRRFRFRFDD